MPTDGDSRLWPLVLDWFVAVAAVAAVAAYLSVYALDLASPPIRSDGFSYYVYLPAWIIHHDPSLQSTAAECCGGSYPKWTAIFQGHERGLWVNPHPIGEALLLTPFFVAADALTRWSNLYRDGFSFYYQHVAGLAGVFYFAAGLACLRRLLLRYFSAGVTLATLVTIVWGTNLFHYATYDSLFAHVFSFFLLAAFLDVMLRPLENPTVARWAVLGAIGALIVLVRHTNGVVLVFPLAYALTLKQARPGWRHVAAALVVFIALLLPQLLLYRYASGMWVFSPYGPNGHFDFLAPKIVPVLLGTQKGLFFWSPVLLLAVAGIPLLPRYVPGVVLPAIVALSITLLLVASWSDWQMGGSFGHRGFTDLMPVFALSLAAFFDWAAMNRRRILITAAAASCVLLSSAQMIQYWLRIIPFSDTSWSVYRSVFLTFRR